MFFSGDPSTRKRVNLGGRSLKERDRQKLLEQARLERKQRLGLRQQNSAAIKIQKCFRGRKVVEAERSKMREQFRNRCQKVDRGCFNPDSEFLSQLLFFFDARNDGDVLVLVETCRLIHQIVQISGGVMSLFWSTDYSSKHAIVENRVKQLAYACLEAVHQNRNRLKDQILMSSELPTLPIIVLLEAMVILTDPELPWACKTVVCLSQQHALLLLRDIVHTGMQNAKIRGISERVSSLESFLVRMISHFGQNQCICSNSNTCWSFSSQILTLPLLWRHFRYLKEGMPAFLGIY